ncbi:M23 family metallopeptidase [Anditalea andensis]|uniref:M23ase beta-sheet core domain-containing protein n=1 Tax=Anditalea andensis TaxID=1048983 RepID=A0A074LMZ6_9BACT|nr:M23 family metallopeptidase [Anditalea andensis]KEO75272.1 hypothetical protein EL17_01660 [Anditalea andensis]
MKLNRFLPSLSILGILLLGAFSNIEKGYYLFPVKPGHQNFLAGNMSEIRPNHFHSGLDIKTEGREGLPIYAAADGYVHRMKISTHGYGNIIYLKHPNGQYTVYAHLRNFNNEIGSFIKKEAYKQQKNEIEVYPEPDELPVKKGDIIANGGNTGSSGGPHLHFEIRDSMDRAIDPLKFGFKEIVDRTPPTVQRIAITPLEIDSRVNGNYQRTEYAVNFDGNRFYINGEVNISGKVGIEVLAYDKLDEMHNPNGFPIYQIYDGDEQIFESNVDVIDFDIGRYLLVHTYGNRYTKLYKSHNNLFDFYQPSAPLSGGIIASPGEKKNIVVKLQDTYQNQSRLELVFNGEALNPNLNRVNNTGGNQKISYQRNVMVINGDKPVTGNLAQVHVNGYVLEIPPSYEGTNKRTYLWDMEHGIPDSINLCNEVIIPDVKVKIPFQEEHCFNDGNTTVTFARNTHFDDLYLRLKNTIAGGDKALTINSPTEHLWNAMEVKMDGSHYQGDRSKAHVYLRYDNGWKSFQGGEWTGDHIYFKTRNFGTFVIAEDNTPPRIVPVRVTASELRFSITDNLSGIDSFEAFVDGEWVWMRYEHKDYVIWSDRLGDKPFKGEIILRVKDKAGNIGEYKSRI